MANWDGTCCPACGASDAVPLTAAAGQRLYCPHCFHGWRPDTPDYSYSSVAMCSLGTSAERLNSQVSFFASFVPSGARVLEIGCATGELAAATRKALPVGSYEGIELSPAGEQAKAQLNRLHSEPLLTLLEKAAIEGPFDIILMSHVLEHIRDPRAELVAMRQVLAETGTIFLEVPNGAGHRRLPIDDNRAHLHFFSASSLARLAAEVGLEVVAAATDVRLDARYADSLQVMLRPFAVPQWESKFLSEHPSLADETEIVVWGAGSLAEEVLANFFDTAKIAFFVDKNPAKQGGTCLGRPVRGPDAIGTAPRTILINSIDFAPLIADDIAALYPNAGHRLIRMGDLL